jgi:hypothetical protein
LSPLKWINSTGAIGFIVKSGRYGGTFAYKDIAFKFASWISVEFELYIVKELIYLSNMENLNAVFINENMYQKERLI